MVSLVDERLSCEGQSDNHLVVIAADHLTALLWLGSLLVQILSTACDSLGLSCRYIDTSNDTQPAGVHEHVAS